MVCRGFFLCRLTQRAVGWGGGRSAHESLPMNHYQIVTTAFGYGAVAFSVAPFTLIAVKLPQPDIQRCRQPFEDRLWRLDPSHPRALAIAATLVRYFEGQAIDIPWAQITLGRFTPAQQTVYRSVAQIPYGQTASYGQVAAMAGLPRAARFVGNTMANNPYPVFIPCHRVIRSDGSAGQFGGGIDLKRKMLALEAAA